MLGIIVTGHGEFAQGLFHANAMIAGELPHVKKVVFADGANLEDYQAQLDSAVNDAVTAYGGAIVLTDLKGGTPFNNAMMVTAAVANTAVLSGTNLPMLIEGSMLAQFSDSAATLAEQLVEVGKNGVDFPQLSVNPSLEEDDAFNEEDGI